MAERARIAAGARPRNGAVVASLRVRAAPAPRIRPRAASSFRRAAAPALQDQAGQAAHARVVVVGREGLSPLLAKEAKWGKIEEERRSPSCRGGTPSSESGREVGRSHARRAASFDGGGAAGAGFRSLAAAFRRP